jgi:flagellar export protein FliJ
MAKFHFRFASVLKVRKTREDEALRALGVAQRAYQLELDRKRELASQLEQGLLRRETLATRPIGIEAFHLEEDFIVGTKHRIVQADRAIVRASRAVSKALRAYLAARRQTRAMETLEDKDRAEFRKHEARREQKGADDFASIRRYLQAEEIAS